MSAVLAARASASGCGRWSSRPSARPSGSPCSRRISGLRELTRTRRVTARRKVSAANERASGGGAAALEEALATTAMPERPRYALADAEDPPSPHGAVALMGTSLSSPLHSPRSARRGDSAADLVAAMTPPGDARDGREVSASPSADSAAAAFVELVTWRRPGATARVAFGGLYAQLCVSSLRTMPLPFGTVACYGFMFALAASLLWRLARGLRLVLLGVSSSVGVRKPETLRTESSERARREVRERAARRFAAKFGGWIAASTARRAPAVAMAGSIRAHAAGTRPPRRRRRAVAARRRPRVRAPTTSRATRSPRRRRSSWRRARNRAATQMAVDDAHRVPAGRPQVQLAGLGVGARRSPRRCWTVRRRYPDGVDARAAKAVDADAVKQRQSPSWGSGDGVASAARAAAAVEPPAAARRRPRRGRRGRPPLRTGGGAYRPPVGGEARSWRFGRAHAGVVADHERGFAFPAARAGRDSKRARRRKKISRREVRPDPTRRRRD